MNAKVSANARTKAGKVLGVVGLAAVLLLGTASAFAESHGGGGGHFSGGGGHVGGGGGHFSGGGHVSAPHFSGGHGFAGGHFSATPHNFSPSVHAQVRAGAGFGYGRGYGGYGVRGSFGYGYHPGWGGGYWHGGYWPRAYYGWSYPLYLGFLPALYATYWWGGIPYYYVNDVYYNWNAADNNYVAVDPPPAAAAGYSDDVNAAAAAGPDAGNAAADNTPSDVAPAAAGAGIIAYPRNGQSDQQQATDKFQCHTWAKGQTGFDPTNQSSSGATGGVRENYGRAMAACLDARGYTVR
jgi:hypothetical protein